MYPDPEKQMRKSSFLHITFPSIDTIFDTTFLICMKN